MQVAISAFYAGVFAIFGLFLSARAGWFRGSAGVSILFGEPVNWELAERVRVHQNFLEYVPMVLILMALLELSGAAALFLHVVGIVLLVARICHLVGLKHDNMAHPGRAIGAGGTALVTLVCAGYLLWLNVPQLFG